MLCGFAGATALAAGDSPSLSSSLTPTPESSSTAKAKDSASTKSQDPAPETSKPSATKTDAKAKEGSSSPTTAPASGDPLGVPAEKPVKPKLDAAYFGGGCFWCLEAVFERFAGVKDVESGYAGGNDQLGPPSYQAVCTGMTGHAEVVKIVFDPSIISYDDLLDVFWLCHDPTTLNAQGPDHGTQYRSVILFKDQEQKVAAQKSYEKIKEQKWYRQPVVTQLVPLTTFFPAEPYHQDYYRLNAGQFYCATVIKPKLRELQAKLAKKAKMEKAAASH